VTCVDNRFWPVGEWTFVQPGPPVVARDLADYRRLLAVVQIVAEVLEEHELLFASTVRFHDPRWDEHDVERRLPDTGVAATLARACERLLGEVRPGPFILPSSTEIFGVGLVRDAAGDAEWMPDVTWLSASAFGELWVNLNTQVDAWMEFTIDARPQQRVHRLNAPRLEAALRAIQQRTGITPDTTDPTRFAVPEPTRLRNQFYEDGEPVDCGILLESRQDSVVPETVEAVDMHRRLAGVDPTTHLPDLAATLGYLGHRLVEANRLEESLVPFQEATDIYRRLVERDPDTYLPYLARLLTSFDLHQVWRTRREEPVPLTTEAVDAYRRLAATDPSTYLPHLVRSLWWFAQRRAADGSQLPQALAAAEEAAEIYCGLAEAARTDILHHMRGTVADILDALGHDDEAADLRRQLEQAGLPVALRPE